METYDNVFGDYDFAQILEDMARPQWRYELIRSDKAQDLVKVNI